MGTEQHWSSFGGAPSIEAHELDSSHLGKDVAVVVSTAAVVGPIAKVTFFKGSPLGEDSIGGWNSVTKVKLTIGYDKSFKVVLEGSHNIYLLGPHAHSAETSKVPA